MRDDQYSAVETYLEIIDDQVSAIWDEWLAAREEPPSKRGYQRWNVVSKSKLQKVWNSFAKFGFVRNESDLDDIASEVITNAARIHVNTALMGHTSDRISSTLNKIDEDITEEEAEELVDGFEDFALDEHGQWRLSDRYNKLDDMAIDVISASTPEEKIIAVDKLLNFVHPRSDLASWFVQGGSNSLAELSAKPNPMRRRRRQ